MMDDQILLRYSRHILLKDIGIEGQEAINRTTVLIVGCGGLGSTVIPILAAAGIGTLILADHDKLELSNLQRQVAYSTADINQPKVQLAYQVAKKLNPLPQVKIIEDYLDEKELLKLAEEVNVLVDCTDNYQTRFLINQASVKTLTPLISGAVSGFEGQITVFDPRKTNSPCYHCLFEKKENSIDNPCALFGVFSPLVALVGAQQAAETLKLVMNIGDPLIGRLMVYDSLLSKANIFYFSRNPSCPTCQNRS